MVPGSSRHGQRPRRIVPPISTPCWPGIRSITGCGCLGVDLGRVGALEAADVAGDLDDGHVQTVADAEVGDAVLAGEPGGGDLALDAARPETGPDEDAGDAAQRPLQLLRRESSRS